MFANTACLSGILTGAILDLARFRVNFLVAFRAEVDSQANNGRLVIQWQESTQKQTFDKLPAQEPVAAELLTLVKQSLAKAIHLTDNTTERCDSIIAELEQ